MMACLPDKAKNYYFLQIRSVLDTPESLASPDPGWEELLAAPGLIREAQAKVLIAAPAEKDAEACLIEGVEALTESLNSKESFMQFYSRFGWRSAEEYFAELGDHQVMVCDVDQNDTDDRLAVIVVAYQMASANAQRRLKDPSATATLFLDARTYAEASGLCMWRTLLLAVRLNSLLSENGFSVQPVLGDRHQVLELVCAYLNVPSDAASLDARFRGTGKMLVTDGRGGTLNNLSTCFCLPGGGPLGVWILSGLCTAQVDDFERCATRGTRLRLVEQSQPAWQSSEVGDSEVQPAFPSGQLLFGAEPSNVRSSGVTSYPETLSNYVRFQRLAQIQPESISHIFPALARKLSMLPVPEGQRMVKVDGRPLNIKPGAEYVVKGAVDPHRLSQAFSALLETAKKNGGDTIYPELCTAWYDDFGNERPEMAHIKKYGSFMADALTICLAARPNAHIGLRPVTRRLALIRFTPAPEAKTTLL